MSTTIAEKSISTLWHTRCPVPTAFSLAWELGALERDFLSEGIEWKSLQETGDAKIIQSHFSHTQEDSFRQGGNIPALWAKSQGADTRLIGLSWVETPYPILVLPDSGIESIADLKGKRLLVLRRSKEKLIDFGRATTLRSYEVALQTAELTLDDVTLVEIALERLYVDSHRPAPLQEKITSRRGGQKEAIAALLRREVDAVALQLAAGLDIAAILGAKILVDVRQLPLIKRARTNNGAPRTLTVSARLAEQRPDLVARVLVHLIEAADWASTHHRDVVRIVAREEHVAEEVIEAAYGPALAHSFATDLSPDNISALKAQASFLSRHGFLENEIDFDAWIDPRPLEQALAIVPQLRNRLVTV